PLLAGEERACGVLVRRSRARAEAHDALGRRAEFCGQEFPARRDEARRPRVLLSLDGEPAGDCRYLRGGARGVSRRERIRQEELGYDPDSKPDDPQWYMVDLKAVEQ